MAACWPRRNNSNTVNKQRILWYQSIGGSLSGNVVLKWIFDISGRQAAHQKCRRYTVSLDSSWRDEVCCLRWIQAPIPFRLGPSTVCGAIMFSHLGKHENCVVLTCVPSINPLRSDINFRNYMFRSDCCWVRAWDLFGSLSVRKRNPDKKWIYICRWHTTWDWFMLYRIFLSH